MTHPLTHPMQVLALTQVIKLTAKELVNRLAVQNYPIGTSSIGNQ